MKEFHRPDEVAALLSVDKRTIYRWIKEGKLSGVKIGPREGGGTVRVHKESLLKLINESDTGD